MVRNECFRVALDYLYKNGLVADQRELSERIGVSETAISQIINNRVRKPSDATIRKLNEAFGNIFNPAYFRGQSIHLLVEDAAYFAAHPEEDPSSNAYVPLDERHKKAEATEKQGAELLLDLAASLIKEVEGLRRQLTDELQQVRTLRDELRSMLKTSNYQIQTPAGAYLSAAEPKEK